MWQTTASYNFWHLIERAISTLQKLVAGLFALLNEMAVNLVSLQVPVLMLLLMVNARQPHLQILII